MPPRTRLAMKKATKSTPLNAQGSPCLLDTVIAEPRLAAHSKQLLLIGAGTALAAHLLGDGEVHLEPAVGDPAVAPSSSFDYRLSRVEYLHSGSPFVGLCSL